MASPTRGTSTRAAQAEQTRLQILQTAQRLFTERGYDATSLQMIADELGLTKAAVYYHFRAKDDILHAAMKPGVEQVKTLLAEAAAMRGRRARIDHVIDGVIDFLVRNRHYTGMATTDPAAKRAQLEDAAALREQTRTMFFGETPTGPERLAHHALFCIPDALPDLADLTDEELASALRSAMLHLLRIRG